MNAPATTPSTRSVLLSLAVLVALVAAVVLALLPPGGDPIATLDLTREPATATVQLRGTDRLRAVADLEFRHRTSQLRRDPAGCALTLAVYQGASLRAQTACSLFPEVSVGRASSARWEPDGRVWRRLEGQRIDCALPSPGEGSYTLRATSTMSRCVPEIITARVTVVR